MQHFLQQPEAASESKRVAIICFPVNEERWECAANSQGGHNNGCYDHIVHHVKATTMQRKIALMSLSYVMLFTLCIMVSLRAYSIGNRNYV